MPHKSKRPAATGHQQRAVSAIYKHWCDKHQKDNIMITRKKRLVKELTPQSVGHDQSTTTRLAGDLFNGTQLPAKYRHLTPLLSTVPAHDVIQCVLACVQVGFNDNQIGDALRTLGEHHQQSEHRCSTCLTWANSDGAIYAGYVDTEGKFAVVVICARCQRLIAAGKATPTMERNLMAYGYGGKR